MRTMQDILKDYFSDEAFGLLFKSRVDKDSEKDMKDAIDDREEMPYPDVASALARAIFSIEHENMKVSHFQYDENYSDEHGLIIVQYTVNVNGKTRTLRPIEIKVPKL